MDQLISKTMLDQLSYHSTLGQSLKQISLRATPIDTILEDIAKYRASYIDTLMQENLIGTRFKSEDSIMRKYRKTLDTNGGFKQCFNDVLGFRLRFDQYPDEFPDYFRVVNLRDGKRIDDGYRAIHLYYQRDNRAYPIEIQLWCGRDYFFNLWSHQYVYKYKTPDIGEQLYLEYSSGRIKSEQEFMSRLHELEVDKNGR
jgi:putative GTP pyrophosphokinase